MSSAAKTTHFKEEWFFTKVRAPIPGILNATCWLGHFLFRGSGAGDPGPKGERGEKGESAPVPSGPISELFNFWKPFPFHGFFFVCSLCCSIKMYNFAFRKNVYHRSYLLPWPSSCLAWAGELKFVGYLLVWNVLLCLKTWNWDCYQHAFFLCFAIVWNSRVICNESKRIDYLTLGK